MRFVRQIIAASAALLLCAGTATAQERLRIAGNFTLDHSSTLAIEQFKKDVEAQTQGRLGRRLIMAQPEPR